MTLFGAALGFPRVLFMFALMLWASAAAIYALRDDEPAHRVLAVVLAAIFAAASCVVARSPWALLVIGGWVLSVKSKGEKTVALGVALLVLGFALIAI